jgi:riboflavin kinase/FMN adenylyltransferase
MTQLEASPYSGQTALTIGAFDGVHRGHQALIQACRDAVGEAGRVQVLTFDPSPGQVLSPSKGRLHTLTSVPMRRALLQAAGADEVTVIPVDIAFLKVEPEAFIDTWVRPHNAAYIVEGPDFRFGRSRRGDLAMLGALGLTQGGVINVLEEQCATLSDGTQVPIRSGTIRWLLEAGRVDQAANLLGRPYALHGPVVRGAQRGRTIGVPTANVDTGALLVPMDGVYAGIGHLPNGSTVPAAISIGSNLTFGEGPRSVEAHLLDFDGAIGDYDWTLSIDLISWVRDQVMCSGIDELKACIARDLDIVRAAVAAHDYAVAP